MVLMSQPDVPIFPPSDLWSDEPPLETTLHLHQMIVLLNCLERLWRDRQDFFAAGNLTIYYSIHQRKSEDFRGPDFFVVLDTEQRDRKSWVVWEEDGKYPNFILEVLSESTALIDRGLKKQIYQDIFRTPEYFWFDPSSLEFQGFKLVYKTYEAILPNEQGWRWSEELQLYLGVWQDQLRFFGPNGDLVPTPEEAEIEAQHRADRAEQQLETERQWLQTERQRADLLQQQLLELGIALEDL